MSQNDRSLERAARSWLEEGPTRAPDRAVEAALARIQTTRQERGPAIPWRLPTMNPTSRIAAIAATGAVAVAFAIFVPRPYSDVGPPASPTPAAATPAAPTIQGTWDVSFTRQDLLDAGVIAHIANDPDDSGRFRLTFSAEEWQLSHLSPRIWATTPAAYTADPGIIHLGSPGDTSFNTPFTVTPTTLTFGDQAPTHLAVRPWTRVASQPFASSIPRPPELPTLSSADVGASPEPGTYLVGDFAAPFTITLPAGWSLSDLTRTGIGFESRSEENANIALMVMENAKVYSDPCHPETIPAAVAPGVDALVGALSGIRGFQVADLKDVSIGAARGKAFTFSNSIDAVAAGCLRNPLPFATRDQDGVAADIEMFGGESDRFWVVDANGTTLLIAITATPRILAAAQPVFDTISFERALSN